MPPVRDQKTHSKGSKEMNLSMVIERHGKSLDDFAQNERKKIQNLRKNIKIISEEKEKLRLDLLRKDNIINELETTIDAKNLEISNITESKNVILDENKLLKCNLMTNESKFTSLEIAYDKSVAGLVSEKSQIQQELESQRNSDNLLKEELTSALRKAEDELLAKKKDLADSIDKFEKLKTDFESYKNTIKEEYECTVNELKAEISDINNKLLQKEEELKKALIEKSEMEEAKNKIIDEQTFKINTIERVVEQPMHRVQPNLNKNSEVLNPITPFHFTEQQEVSDPTNQSLRPTNRARSIYEDVSNIQPTQSIISRSNSYEATTTTNQTAAITALPSMSSVSQIGSRYPKRLRTNNQEYISNSQAHSTISSNNRQSTNSRPITNHRITGYNSDDSGSDSDVSMSSTLFRNANNDRNNSFNIPQGFNIVRRPKEKHSQFQNEFDLLKHSKFE